MADPNQRRYRKLFAAEFKLAGDYLLPRWGGRLDWVAADYEAFHYTLPDARLVFYPHRTSASNHHIRVRDGGSKNKERAAAIMSLLQVDKVGGPGLCTFHQKNNHAAIWLGGDHPDTRRKVAELRRQAGPLLKPE